MYKFADLFEIIDGDRGKNYPSDSDFSEDGYCLFLNAGNVTKNGWSFEKNSFITEEKDSILRKGRVERGSLVLTTRGTVGNVALYDDSVPYEHIRINSGMVILKSKIPDELYDHFAYYLLISPYIKKKIELFCSGSAQPQLPIKDFIKIKVDLPSINKQHNIVNIISVFDQAIENNNKRKKILEQTAENLYKEWFVRFRFPGHEGVEFEGGIPKNWKLKKVEEIGEVVAGGTPSTDIEEYWNGDIAWLTPADLADFDGVYIAKGNKNITELGLKKSSAKMMPQDTVLLSSRAPIGYVALSRNEICTNQGFKSVICDEECVTHQYLFYFFKMNKSLLEAYGSGATFLELSGGSLKRIKILVPSMELQKEFSDIVDSIFEEIYSLSERNNNLKKQRDLLLPRLMSGKLEVK